MLDCVEFICLDGLLFYFQIVVVFVGLEMLIGEQLIIVVCVVCDVVNEVLWCCGWVVLVQIFVQEIIGGVLCLQVVIVWIVDVWVRGDVGWYELFLCCWIVVIQVMDFFNECEVECLLLFVGDVLGLDVVLLL